MEHGAWSMEHGLKFSFLKTKMKQVIPTSKARRELEIIKD
jgi:hypothetical protein